MVEHSKKTDQESIIETAKKRFNLGVDADSENRELAREDMQFRSGEQWPEHIKRDRETDGRPLLTINKIPQFVHQITNDQRQNRPSIKVNPFDDQADPDTAKILQGLIRNIENNSNADTAYDIGFDSAVSGGRGWLRVLTEYCDPYSFDQDIKIVGIRNPESVVVDPMYKEPDGSDMNWAFISDDLSMEEYEALYPDSDACSDTFNWESARSNTAWFGEKTVRVAEYFSKELKDDILIRLPDGSTALKSEIDKMDEERFSLLEISREEIDELSKDENNSRKTQVPVIKWYKINGAEILEETEWVSHWIPIVPIHGEELWVDGKRIFEGIIRHAKDPQKMYNYWATCETEAIALAPKTPWIGYEGQFEGHESKWNSAHTKNYSYLEVKDTTLKDGSAAPLPQRVFGEANVQAITQARMLSSDDLKATTGIYDAALGNRSNEASGIAINRRAQQAQTGNFHFVDNLSRSIRHIGRILIDIIPKIYDSERVIRVLGEDDQQEIVAINALFKDKDGKPRQYDLSIGKYDVSVSTGPSYASKRQEALEGLLSLVQSYPGIAQFAGDILVKCMDFDYAEELAERLKKTIPPEVLSDDETEIPPEVKAQLDQMGQMLEEMTAKYNEAQDKIDNKLIEIESKERIEMAKIEKDYVIKEAELKAKENASPDDLKIIAGEILDLNERLETLNFSIPINQDEIANQLEQDINNNPPGGMSPEMTGQGPMEN